MSQRFTPDSRPPGEPAETDAIGQSDSVADPISDPAAPQPIDPAALANAQNTASPDALLAIVVDTFKALADSTRTRILYALLRAPLCVRDLALLVDVSESAVSHHLRLLRDRRLVTTRRDGTDIYYALDETIPTSPMPELPWSCAGPKPTAWPWINFIAISPASPSRAPTIPARAIPRRSGSPTATPPEKIPPASKSPSR